MWGNSEEYLGSKRDYKHSGNKKIDIKKNLTNRLDNSYKEIKHAYTEFIEDSSRGKVIPKATEWLLNDFYLIDLKYRRLKLDLRKEKKIKLYTMQEGLFKGYPRIYSLALNLIYNIKTDMTEDKIIEFINEYQTEYILSLEEIARFQSILSFALIEYIRDIVLELARDNDIWRKMDKIELTDETDIDDVIKYVNIMSPTEIESLIKKIKKNRTDSKAIIKKIDAKLKYIGKSIKNIIETEYMNQTKYNVNIGYGIKSLREISNMNWNKIVDEISLVEKIYGEDPIDVYDNMEKISKGYYKQKTAEFAEQFQVQEVFVAEKALEFAKENWDNGIKDKKSHIGYYLLDDGRKKMFDYFDVNKRNTSLFLKRYSDYYVPITIVSVILAFLFGSYAFQRGNIYLSVLVFILTLTPSMTLSTEIVNYLYFKKFNPKHLPKMNYKHTIPLEATTMVVVPSLLTDKTRVQEMVKHLEVHYLSNNEENIYFALLGDSKDSMTEKMDVDKEVVETGLELISQLNKKYRKVKGKDIFYFLHRKRTHSQTQGMWIGWEKKRGSLLEFNDLLLGNTDTSIDVVSGDVSGLKIKYVITLDGDTKLPIDGAKRLIGTISHPLNKAVEDKDNKIIKEGYGIIQPRIAVDIQSSNKNLFTRIFAGMGGLDPYSVGVSDIYQDLFGDGIFIGKGIYDLDIFQKYLKNTIPENTVLSHDLLESNYIRAGLANDIVLIDEYPEKYISYMLREHRWVRGDWQIIRWLKDRAITSLSKWKILDNMRRSILPISLFLILFLGTILLPGNSLFWIMIYLLSSLFPIFTMFVEHILYRRFKTSKIKLSGNLILGYKTFLYQGILYLMFLPYRAMIILDAITRTLYRVFISKKNLLEWTTAFEMEKKIKDKDDVLTYYKTMIANTVSSVLVISLTYVFRPNNTVISLILGLLWILGPLLAYKISRVETVNLDVDESNIDLLKGVASQTWDYYDAFVNKEHNFLPPDNFQEYPYRGAANSTSPTNIGFYLLSLLSSNDLGFISKMNMIKSIDSTITTIEKMEKWKGHLYNWYDTKSLNPLRPAFISTVDSGNFVSYLIVLKEALKEHLNNPITSSIDIKELINRIERLIDKTKFSPLYDYDKNLFYIGYEIDADKPSENHYDLLASEARITSYMTVCKRDVPLEHWYRLGRALLMNKGHISVVSWSGTMFEYLMPTIVLKDYRNTLLDETYRTVVRMQEEYGNERNIPWGISESGFFAFDHRLNYQYKAFGLASLGFKRGLKDELVVSPYSTFLALKFDPRAVLDNIRNLEREGLRGQYGFYEAVDYTTNRLPVGDEKGIVKSYMSHHQGMILCSINNFINNDILVDRFYRDPQMKAGEFLLQEKIPTFTILTEEKHEIVERDIVRESDDVLTQRIYCQQGIKCQLLSSSSYSLMINNRGEGFSKDNELYINRWRSDYLNVPYGQFIYINDLKNQKIWSTTYAPTFEEPDEYKVDFFNYKASFYRKDGDIDTEMDVFLLPEELGEIRKVSIKNNGKEESIIEITSYFEVVADTLQTDMAHPSFSNLFVRTEALKEQEAILAYRRKREEGEERWISHGISVFDDGADSYQYETNRDNFIGRGNSLKRPKAVLNKGLSNTVGTVLDPVMSCSKKIKIAPGASTEVYYITSISDSRESAIDLLNKYRNLDNINMAEELAKTKSSIEIGYLELNHANINLCEDLLSRVLYTRTNDKIKYKEILNKNTKGQSSLWAQGISGDNPIVLVTIESLEGIDTIEKLVDANEYWSYRGLVIDLVILKSEDVSYHEPLADNIKEVIFKSRAGAIVHLGGIFTVDRNTLTDEDIFILYKWARLIINAEEGLTKGERIVEAIPDREISIEKELNYPFVEPLKLDLAYFNGYGGFSENGREYVINLTKELNTPLPWSNVIANKHFGFLVTECGTGYTWAGNSRENKLTPWYNDPVVDNPGEIVYIRDDDTGEFWSITPKPIMSESDCTITHGMGYSKFSQQDHGLKQNLTLFVPEEDNVKISLIDLENKRNKKVNLTLFYYIRPVLGVSDEQTQNLLETEVAENIFMVKNSTNTEFENSTMFIGTSEEIASYTGDRIEFIGDTPNYENPRGIKKERLSNSVGFGYNPCSVIEVKVELEADDKKELVFLLGEATNFVKGKQLIEYYSDVDNSKSALETSVEFWKKKTGMIEVNTPETSMNYMMNAWLVYQTIACRIWARSGFYQSGGAFGARDQMQDVTNMLYQVPDEARKQIIRNCKHQYLEGDVQHWWHPDYSSEVSKGIRSKCSDDLLWLPYGVAEYISFTGDEDVLEEETFFIESPVLSEEEQERYEVPTKSETTGTVYEHCIRSIDKSLVFGERGLPLMGSGDWNDGMNKVGYKGRGESVWLAWFLTTVLDKFIPICEKKEDFKRVELYRDTIAKLKESVEENAWDGHWYKRAFFDDGTAIGSEENTECSIDSIAQSWSVISGLGGKERSETALAYVEKHLVNQEQGIIALLTPPFDSTDLDPGYIKAYVPGVRENGGQYTHAATWLIKAFAMLKQGDKATNLFNLINPINHSRTSIECSKYKVEPYVIAADVYTNPQHIGRGGWTWYTGSSGWLYNVGLENILGFKVIKDKLFIDPCIPKDWKEYSIKYTYGSTIYNIEVRNKGSVSSGVGSITVDGKVVEDYIALCDDNLTHLIEVELIH